MSTAIAPYVNASLEEKRAYVQTLAQAGELLPKGLWENKKNAQGVLENKPSPGKIMLIMETGLMLGLHPMAAFQGIDVIEGKPTLKPALMTALIRSADGFQLRIQETGTVGGGDIACTTTIIRGDDPDHPYISTWTPTEAILAGLVDSYAKGQDGVWVLKARDKNGEPKPWERYTKRLLRWRSVGDCASAGAEDVLFGMHYTAEELGATVDEQGGVVDAPAESSPTEDWEALIKAAMTADEITAILERAQLARQHTDEVLTMALTRRGMLSRAAEDIVDAEVVEDEAPVEAEASEPPTEATPEPEPELEPEETKLQRYERETAAEYDAEKNLTGA